MKRYLILILVILVLASGLVTSCGSGLQTFNNHGISFKVSKELKLEEYAVNFEKQTFRKGTASYEQGAVLSTEKNFTLLWLTTVPQYSPAEVRSSILSTPTSFESASGNFQAEIAEDLVKQQISGFEVTSARMQEYLNRSDALWGIVTNGSRLRLLRNIVRISKPTYLEFDLEGMVAGNLYSEFVLLYRLLHATRFPTLGADPHKCFIEEYYQQGIDEGGRVRDKLRDGVKNALENLGNGFLSHPWSDALRDRFQKQSITETGFYRQLLRLVYRFLFLSAAEERHLLFPQQTLSTEKYNIYRRYYSVSQLRDRAERYFRGDANFDCWLGLIKTFDILRDDHLATQLGLAALNGELFSRSNCHDLENAFCSNENLLAAIRELSTWENDGIRRRVNYAGLDVEEFGSVYESLLDYHPRVDIDT